MNCRLGCGACCIAPSISSAIPGLPFGKPAGVRCPNLDDEFLCRIWGTPEFPNVCARFVPQKSVCGNSRIEALTLIETLEAATAPSVGNQ